jgi:hypothetical protein
MTLTFGFTKVGRGVTLGLVGVVLSSHALAAADAPAKQRSGVVSMTTGETATGPAPNVAAERFQLGVGVGFFGEDSERRRESLTGGQQTRDEEPEELESSGIYNLQVWYLQPIWFRGFRLGGGLAWFNEYAVEAPDAEEDDEPFVMGQLFQLGLQSEYELNAAGRLGVVFGLRGGASFLFPSSNLRDDIEDLGRRGFDVWESPQLGLYLAPLLGVRFPLSKRVSLRSDLSVQFGKLWLYDAEGEAAGITSERSSTLGTTRIQFLIGLDFGL